MISLCYYNTTALYYRSRHARRLLSAHTINTIKIQLRRQCLYTREMEIIVINDRTPVSIVSPTVFFLYIYLFSIFFFYFSLTSNYYY